jgi:hypothetical protein
MNDCKTCRFLDVKPDSAGRLRVIKDKAYRCLAPTPSLPPLPLSITDSFYFPLWPPSRTVVDAEKRNCPVWEPRNPREIDQAGGK